MRFHPLPITDKRAETDDAVSLAFAVPPELAERFRFRAGQYLTLRAVIDGAEVRRCYSICAAPGDGELRVGIKTVPEGRFSTWARDRLAVGDQVEVMAPEGRFTPDIVPGATRSYVAFAAGSGITPILSIAAAVLAGEPESRFTLFYGNRTAASIMFREALEDMKNRYMTRFALHHVLSREHQDFELFNGRLDAAKLHRFAGRLFWPATVDRYLLCGPSTMIADLTAGLRELGVAPERIMVERFATPDQPAAPARSAESAVRRDGEARITVIQAGLEHRFAMPFDGGAILDAGLRHGIDLPFSCKGGVCSTCRCRKRAGEVAMGLNYALEPWELEAGFVLACQSRPVSDEVVLDFDAA